MRRIEFAKMIRGSVGVAGFTHPTAATHRQSLVLYPTTDLVEWHFQGETTLSSLRDESINGTVVLSSVVRSAE